MTGCNDCIQNMEQNHMAIIMDKVYYLIQIFKFGDFMYTVMLKL